MPRPYKTSKEFDRILVKLQKKDKQLYENLLNKTEKELQKIKQSKKILLGTEDPDILKELEIGTKELDEYFDDLIETITENRKGLEIKKEIIKAKEKALTLLRNKYGKIAKEKAKLETEGFISLAVRGAENLRGIMGKKREVSFISEIVKTKQAKQ